jgi:hypothetical protein
MATVLRYVGDGRAADIPDGSYLEAFDPDVQNGRGYTKWTTDPIFAMRFVDAGAAMETWRMTSKTHPVRDDGKPNRPLTAFTVIAEAAP